MNNQELIKKYEKLEGVCTDPGAEIARLIFLEDLRELDEPQKVTVPQIVADYIEYAKDCDWDLIDAMKGIGYEDCDDLLKWFYKDKNQETFARAWLDGYEVEQEKRYLVKMKGVNDYGCYLNKGLLSKKYFWESKSEIGGCRTKHTRKKLEQDNFGWVFDCPGIEIEEV